MDAKSGLEMDEKAVALHLGVSTRMVRNYLRLHELPCVGNGRERKFEWLKVLEWYVGYRVNVGFKGGRQKSTLHGSLRNLRDEAVSSERSKCFGVFDARLRKEKQRSSQEVRRLEEEAAGSVPKRYRRPRRRSTR